MSIRRLCVVVVAYLALVRMAAAATCGAVPNDGLDDTSVIQACIESAVVGDTVTLLPGTYNINPGTGVRVTKSLTLELRGAQFLCVPNVAPRSKALEIAPGVTDVKVFGGEFIGSRTGVTGLQWAIGLRIDQAERVLVEGATFRNWYFDGLTITGNITPTADIPSRDVTIRDVHIVGCRRNGLSVIHADGVLIDGVHASGSDTDPGAGIDLEPNVGQYVHNVTIMNSTLIGNRRGLYLHQGAGLPGSNYAIINTYVADNVDPVGSATYQIIFSGVNGVTVLDSIIEAATTPAPRPGDVGVNFSNCRDVVFARNVVRSPIPIRVVNVTNALLFRNDLDPDDPDDGLTIQTVGRGLVGAVAVVP